MLPLLSECLGRVVTMPPAAKLEALELWLSARIDAALSVGAGLSERQCMIRAHGVTFTSVVQGSGWPPTWQAICEAVEACEFYERTPRTGAPRTGVG